VHTALILFLLFQNNPLGIPLGGKEIGTINTLHYQGRNLVGQSGEVRIDFKKYYAHPEKLIAPMSCKVKDLTKDGPVYILDTDAKDHQIFQAPVGHILKWSCKGNIPRKKTSKL
jgi:hypothetical protein